MIREVEIRNTVESVKMGSTHPPYTTDPEVPMITGFVTNDGQSLTVDVNRELKTGHTRFVYLFYSAVDLEYKQVSYHHLDTSDMILGDTPATTHEFDISSVLTIPKSSPKIFDYTEITIDLFTYEANITDNTGTAIYGQKRLSVPYKAEMGARDQFPVSTDGWYPIGVVDYLYRDMNNIVVSDYFYKGDLVYFYSSLDSKEEGIYKCLEGTSSNPLTEGFWELAAIEDIMAFFTIPLPANITTAETIVGANAIISRYVKKKYLTDLLTTTSYKPFDDAKALYLLMQVGSLREDSILKLEDGNLVLASYLLDMCGYEFNAGIKSDQDITYRQINTNYTA